MIRTWIAELISNYSWINRIEKRGLYYFIFYNIDTKETFSRISYRANKAQLQRFLKRIKYEADEIEQRKLFIEQI